MIYKNNLVISNKFICKHQNSIYDSLLNFQSLYLKTGVIYSLRTYFSSVLQRGHSGDGCLFSSILFKCECRRGHLFVPSWATTGCSGEYRFAIMCVEWYGVCNFVVSSVV